MLFDVDSSMCFYFLLFLLKSENNFMYRVIERFAW